MAVNSEIEDRRQNMSATFFVILHLNVQDSSGSVWLHRHSFIPLPFALLHTHSLTLLTNAHTCIIAISALIHRLSVVLAGIICVLERSTSSSFTWRGTY